MNNYQKQKAKRVSEVESLMAKLEGNAEALEVLAAYKESLNDSAERKNWFSMFFPSIGSSRTAREIAEMSDYRIVADARQLYQWRARGYNVSKVGDVFCYVSFDAEKHDQFLAKQREQHKKYNAK
jgi:hypothetical protein